MTLALYGKTGRRKAVLLLGALFALAVAILGGSTLENTGPAAAASTAALDPTANGTYIAWTNDFDEVNDRAATACADDTTFVSSTVNTAMESFPISLVAVPEGATIFSLDVTFCHFRPGSSASLRPFVRLNGNDENGTTIAAASPNKQATTQEVDFTDIVKGAGTTIEIGVEHRTIAANEIRVFQLSAVVNYTVPAAPNLTLTKGDSPDPVTEDGTITYTIDVGNDGNADTSGTITVSDTVPTNTTFVSASGGADWTCVLVTGTVSCTSNTPIPAGGTGQDITLVVKVNDDFCGQITNTANVEGGGDSGDPPDASATATTNSTGCDGSIVVQKVVTNVTADATAFDASIDGGGSFTFSETAASSSQAAAAGARLVTEAAETNYTTLGWAVGGQGTCPATPTGSVAGSTGVDNTAEVSVASNATTYVCFYNSLQGGSIVVQKVVTNVANDATAFDASIDGERRSRSRRLPRRRRRRLRRARAW
ncbi:MAG: hypothetical protein ACR2HN_03155 [Tepidiformaceae bacterium]